MSKRVGTVERMLVSGMEQEKRLRNEERELMAPSELVCYTLSVLWKLAQACSKCFWKSQYYSRTKYITQGLFLLLSVKQAVCSLDVFFLLSCCQYYREEAWNTIFMYRYSVFLSLRVSSNLIREKYRNFKVEFLQINEHTFKLKNVQKSHILWFSF